MQDLKISLIQSDLHWESPAANMAMFEEKIWSDVGDTDVIILPEMFTTGFSMSANKLAEPPFTNTYKWMHQVAKEKSALVMGSYMVKENGSNYNRLYAIFPDGKSEYYDKRHLFGLGGEDKPYVSGSKRLILEWKGWRMCPMICYDLRFPAWARNHIESNQYDYDLLIYVANWPKPRISAWDTLLKARAIENQCYVAGVNRIGSDDVGHEYVGNSGVYDFLGNTLEVEENKDAVISLSLTKENMNEFRTKYPFLKDSDIFKIEQCS